MFFLVEPGTGEEVSGSASQEKAMQKFNAAQEVTNKIIEAIESGLADGRKWVMPWQSHGELSMPLNALTGKTYRGGNIVSLWASGKTSGFTSGYWASFKQWKALGAQVKKASKGTSIVFWKKFHIEDDEAPADEESDDRKSHLKCWSSKVFNADQVEGWEPPESTVPDHEERLESAETFFANTGLDIRYGQGQAFYCPAEDYIGMPSRSCFVATEYGTASEHFYSVLAHEAAHASGAKHRLDRDLSGRFGSEKYAAEELVAEISSAMTCALLNISPAPREDHFHYVKNWLDVLRGDKYAIFTAASKAQAATEYLQGLQGEGEQ
ncbi:ArdC family protein [Kiloniella sp.]|uniref:ArdC family protein n=1 Tax=Kiloniella sp. TaxID=1938587 RepID=UPI003B027A09